MTRLAISNNGKGALILLEDVSVALDLSTMGRLPVDLAAREESELRTASIKIIDNLLRFGKMVAVTSQARLLILSLEEVRTVGFIADVLSVVVDMFQHVNESVLAGSFNGIAEVLRKGETLVLCYRRLLHQSPHFYLQIPCMNQQKRSIIKCNS